MVRVRGGLRGAEDRELDGIVPKPAADPDDPDFGRLDVAVRHSPQIDSQKRLAWRGPCTNSRLQGRGLGGLGCQVPIGLQGRADVGGGGRVAGVILREVSGVAGRMFGDGD